MNEGDAVFLLGYPGRTARHKTASFLKYEEQVRLPTIVDLYNWQIDVMTTTGAEDRAVAIKHASRMPGLANVEKRSRGQLKGLRRAHITQTRLMQEKELQAYIDDDPMRAAKYGSLLTDIAAVYQEITAAAPLEIHLAQLRSAPRAVAFGYFVVNAVTERQKPDLERESPYMDRNFEQSVQRLKVSMGDYHPPTDQILLAGILERLANLPGVQGIGPLQRLLAKPDQINAIATDLMETTRLGDVAFVEECLSLTPEQLTRVEDPLLRLIVNLYPTYLEMRELDKEREGRLSRLYGSLIEVKQQFLATDFVPDANATLRLTCGRVRSYSPEDAVIKTPITTLSGVLDKTTGVEPFITPEELIQARAEGRFRRFRNQQLDDVPVAILYDTDTTGGNSGSPILNAQGRLVGVNFDRCFEATINDFAWNQSYSRSIGVDIRYVLWITGVVYSADHLLKEMGVSMND